MSTFFLKYNINTFKMDTKPDVNISQHPTKTVCMEYPHILKLERLCKSFIGKEIYLVCTFNGKSTRIGNVNIIGDLLEDVFFPYYKEVCSDFEKGPKQESPDFFAQDKTFLFEQKAFYKNPSFDISNFTSFIHEISKPNGLVTKLFYTKYLVYEYDIHDERFIITGFWLLNVWNLPQYDNKYPMSVQIKKNMWYNIRPGAKTKWLDTCKTPMRFLENLIKCLDMCNHVIDKQTMRQSIITQMEEAKRLGFL